VTSFAANFTLAEFTRASTRAPDAVEVQKAARLSMLLEIIRHATGGEPVIVTEWIAPRDRDGPGHPTGDAVDVRLTRKLSQRELVDRVTAALHAAGVQWGELIFYPFTDWHIHLTLYPVGVLNEVLVADSSGKVYSSVTPAVLASFPSTAAPFPPSQVAGAVVVALGVGLVAAVGIGAVLS
jgi:hypothetical protein